MSNRAVVWDHLSACLRALGKADPSSFFGRIDDLHGSGYPKQSDGSRSSEHGLPLPDALDSRLQTLEKDYIKSFGRAAAELESNDRRQNAVLLVVSNEEATKELLEAKGPNAGECEKCGVIVDGSEDDRLRVGKCFKCYRAKGA